MAARHRGRWCLGPERRIEQVERAVRLSSAVRAPPVGKRRLRLFLPACDEPTNHAAACQQDVRRRVRARSMAHRQMSDCKSIAGEDMRRITWRSLSSVTSPCVPRCSHNSLILVWSGVEFPRRTVGFRSAMRSMSRECGDLIDFIVCEVSSDLEDFLNSRRLDDGRSDDGVMVRPIWLRSSLSSATARIITNATLPVADALLGVGWKLTASISRSASRVDLRI
jgi:hypothetical protein